jgi:CheY-like chemotaxis protein
MTPDVMAQAIEPFFTTKDVGKGSGLGLSMVYGFARQSGGDLRIESEVGVGTQITLILPQAVAPARSAPTPAKQSPNAVSRVLVVDDDALVREALCLQLRDAGFATIAASDGPSALGLIDQGAKFDVLLTDMVMPHGMSGLDLAEQVRERRPEARAILSTGYAEQELPEEGPNWRLLRKPYTASELFSALRTAMFMQR